MHPPAVQHRVRLRPPLAPWRPPSSSGRGVGWDRVMVVGGSAGKGRGRSQCLARLRFPRGCRREGACPEQGGLHTGGGTQCGGATWLGWCAWGSQAWGESHSVAGGTGPEGSYSLTGVTWSDGGSHRTTGVHGVGGGHTGEGSAAWGGSTVFVGGHTAWGGFTWCVGGITRHGRGSYSAGGSDSGRGHLSGQLSPGSATRALLQLQRCHGSYHRRPPCPCGGLGTWGWL